MKKREYKNPNFNNKNLDKKFIGETNDDENCNCWVCEAQKNKMKNVKRENSLLGNIITFLQ